MDSQITSGEISFIPIDVIDNVNWLTKARFIWNDLDYRWQRWVINYNSDYRSKFLATLGINHIRSLVIWLIVSIGVFIALLSLLLFRRQNKKLDKASIVYNRYCARLAKKQLFIGTSGEAKDFSERALARFPDQAEKIADITNLYIKIR